MCELLVSATIQYRLASPVFVGISIVCRFNVITAAGSRGT
jgi:hypothetical protein